MIRRLLLGLLWSMSLAVHADEPAAGQPVLTVSRFWFPFPFPDKPQPDIILHTYGVGPDALYLSTIVQNHRSDPSKPGNVATFFRVSLPDLQTEEIPLTADDAHDLHNLPETIDVAPDALYATTRGVGEHTSRLQRYDPQMKTWTVHDLPPDFNFAFCRSNTAFYFGLSKLDGNPAPGRPMPPAENAVSQYDWDTGTVTLLSSSRRRPGQNQLDDRAAYHVKGLFLGPNGKPCMTTPAGTLYIQDTPGNWPEVFDGSWFDEAMTVLGKTLVFNLAGEMTLIDSQKAVPEPWMAAKETVYRKEPVAGIPPTKVPTPWADQTLWDAPGKVFPNEIGFHDDWLFILKPPKVKGGLYDLLCYQKGHGRSPRHIPLQFKLNDQMRPALALHTGKIPNGWVVSDIEHPDTTIIGTEVMSTGQGLGFRLMMAGFWFLPYSDITAYLNSIPN
jgi:hypothetical protein